MDGLAGRVEDMKFTSGAFPYAKNKFETSNRTNFVEMVLNEVTYDIVGVNYPVKASDAVMCDGV